MTENTPEYQCERPPVLTPEGWTDCPVTATTFVHGRFLCDECAKNYADWLDSQHVAFSALMGITHNPK